MCMDCSWGIHSWLPMAVSQPLEWFYPLTRQHTTTFSPTKSFYSHRDIQIDPLHVHFVDDKDEGLVPVGIQVARLHRRLLLLTNALALKKVWQSVDLLSFSPTYRPYFLRFSSADNAPNTSRPDKHRVPSLRSQILSTLTFFVSCLL